MSFFDDASLAFLPSGAAGKDGKAYSIKPTDGTGDFTFSRGSNLAATRVGADGLIEKGRENVLLYSEQFDNPYYVKALGTITSNQTTAPDGSLTADLFTKTTSVNTVSELRPSSAPYSSTGIFTFSVYVKQNVGNDVLLRLDAAFNTANAAFQFSTKSIATIGSNAIDATATELPNGWFRLSITGNVTNASWNLSVVNLYPNPANDSFFVWGAQLEQGLAATDYIESGATTGKAGLLEDEPRFDYSGGATCPSLLLEPSRTQLVTQSEYLLGYFATDGITLSHNHGVSPEGADNSVLITQTGGVASNSIYNFNLPITDGTYTYSFFFKAGTSTLCRFYCGTGVTENFNPQNVTAGYTGGSLNLLFENYGNDWWRVSANQTLSGASTNRFAFNPDYGNNGNNVEIYGFQIEEGSYPTSYIPNHSGGSVTRGADAMDEQISGLTSLDKGTFFVDFDRGLTTATSRDISTQGLYYEILNTFAGLNQGIEIATNADGSIRAAVRTSSGFSSLYTNNTLSRFKILYKWSGTELKVFVNGSSVYSNSTKWGEITSALQYIGYNADFRKSINQVLVFTEALSDADCITLTTL